MKSSATDEQSLSTQKAKSDSKKSARTRKLIERCENLLGKKAVNKEYPGGRSRDSFRLFLQGGHSVIATKRSRTFRAEREVQILQKLAPQGAPVPLLLAHDGRRLLIQQEVNGRRLSEAINDAETTNLHQLLDTALSNLARIHQLGSEAGFDKSIPQLGTSLNWIVGLLDRPAIVGRYFDISAPRPQLPQLESLLSVQKPRFIKWDARPGNAMVTANDDVFWIDWEHCCARNRIDDLVWLLGDEFVPNLPKIESQLLTQRLPDFADHFSIDQATEYFYAYGVFHSTVRLGLILKYKERGDWWDREYCLENDKIGITLDNALTTCSRASRWASQTPYTKALSPWFEAMADRIKTL